MKKLLITIILLLAALSFSFAGGDQEVAAVSAPTQAIVTNTEEVLQAAGAEGPWIIITEQDVTVDKDIVVEGEVYEDADADAPRRKFALYAQDEDHNITNRYTLTAPKLIIRHENVRIQGGTFKGDVYVEAEGFHLRDATIDGDIYFDSDDLKSSFEMDDASKVTGEMIVE